MIERCPHQPVGAGLTLQPNAVRLRCAGWGCADDVEHVGAHLRFGGLRRADGSPLSVLSAADAERIEETVGAPASVSTGPPCALLWLGMLNNSASQVSSPRMRIAVTSQNATADGKAA